jgi:DNA-binding MarR family transcriptional regulator
MVEPADSRRRLLELTARGSQAVAVARATRAAVLGELEAAVGPRAVATTGRTLTAALAVLGVTDEVDRRAVRPGAESS